MKKLSLLIIILLSLAGCNVLDVKPQSSIPAADAFKDKQGIEKGILGAYTSFQSLSYYGRSYLIFSDLSADNLEHPLEATAQEYTQIDNNNILPENASVSSMWASIYEGINYANNVIAKVPSMSDMTDVEKNKALGELYFIRALNHFNAMNYFGAVPVKITPTIGTDGFNVPREAISKVFNQIISDLTFAEQNLVKTSEKTRASKYAATALLARVYLYKGDYALAKTKADDVIKNGGHTIIPYATIFTDQSAESIFEIDFTTLIRNRIAEYNFPKSLNGRREVAPTADLVKAYEVGDKRYTASLAFAGTLPYAIKYDDLAIGEDNVIVLRLAEMYLIRAEAEAMLKGDVDAIQDDINVIRTRANLPSTVATAYDDLLKIIEKERRIEFAFEGHRWFDLVRTKRATAVLINVTSINKTLFPIPLDELQTNTNKDMIQNTGY